MECGESQINGSRGPELLAPAGEWDSLVAAIQSGADAVYIGGTVFSARQFASNFSKEEICKAVEYAHVRGAKIYVTVNTLLRDDELREAADYLKFLKDAGVDAVIFQDLGVMTMVRQLVPDLALHGSTQMTVHNMSGLKFVSSFGLERVILSRELGLEEIRELVESGLTQIEIFVHGALCFSYSGQCLMSSLIGSRSGNRGRCAQPCRLQYTLLDWEGREMDVDVGPHLLSTRDLCLISHIPEIVESGVHSLKIEGRMKRPEYVATVVRIYREALDSYIQDPPNFKVTEHMMNALLQAFNRGFTNAYFLEDPGRELMSYQRPNNRGVFLGRVSKYDTRRGSATLRLEAPLGSGDQVEVWVSRGGRCTTTIDTLSKSREQVQKAQVGETVCITISGNISSGDRVFKVYDAQLANEAIQTYRSPKELKRIPISMEARVVPGEPFTLTLSDAAGRCATASSDFVVEVARKHPLTRQRVAEQLLRLGNVPYEVEKLDIHIEGQAMVPFSQMNKVRRQAIDDLSAKRKGTGKHVPYEKSFHEMYSALLTHRSEVGKVPLLSVAVEDLEALKAALQGGADLIYISSEAGSEAIEAGASICVQRKVPLFIRTPRIIKEEELISIEKSFGYVKKGQVQGILAGEMGALARAIALELPVYTDMGFNVFNSLTAALLAEEGVEQATLSVELAIEEIASMVKPETMGFEAIIHGYSPMIISEHSLLSTLVGSHALGRRFKLKDRKGFNFPVREDIYGRTHIYNSVKTCMLQHIPDLARCNLDFLRIETWGEGQAEIEELVSIYRENLEAFSRSPDDYQLSSRGRVLLDKLSQEGITKGHYFRGV